MRGRQTSTTTIQPPIAVARKRRRLDEAARENTVRPRSIMQRMVSISILPDDYPELLELLKREICAAVCAPRWPSMMS